MESKENYTPREVAKIVKAYSALEKTLNFFKELPMRTFFANTCGEKRGLGSSKYKAKQALKKFSYCERNIPENVYRELGIDRSKVSEIKEYFKRFV